MKKILIVDDQPDVKKLLKIILQSEDRVLLCADSGEEAITLARAERPDVILLDVMMPGGMDGYQTTKILKSDPQTCGCAIIAMTAKVQEQDRLAAFDAGADDYLGKPFDMRELQKKVADFLS
ncbi:response regulator transcription factor [Trichloromonas sp.]|uniref:response regulator transcription factor n=1 Tax=Trichloromonas sp. TaxID=3069249 RepID=UPI003D819E42